MIADEAYVFAEEIKEEFAPTEQTPEKFPQALTVMLEKALYHSDSAETRGEDSVYEQTIDTMGANRYILDLEDLYVHFPKIADYREQIQWKDEAIAHICQFYEIPLNCCNCFYIPATDGKDYYVFTAWQGGSNGAFFVCLTERVGDDFVWINKFETQNEGDGRVIQYEDEFYYIFWQYNYNLKVYDALKIHRLKDNPEEETMVIRYLPKQYIWKPSCLASPYLTNTDADNEIDAYIAQVKDEITSEQYLDRGTSRYAADVYYGEEEMVVFTLGAYEKTVYKMDIANCGEPVYLWKSMFEPSSIHAAAHLRTKFFLYDAQTASERELDRLGQYDLQIGIRLVQMWFQKIDGKVYTFRMYHVSGYNYMLNVMLLEQDKATQVKAYLLSPQREFVVTEGEVFTTKG